MERNGITLVEGEKSQNLSLSLQFVISGSQEHGEYGCFFSGRESLENIERIMSEQKMIPDDIETFPSIIMLDADILTEFDDNNSKDCPLVFKLLQNIYMDIKYKRLAIDSFDMLCNNNSSTYEKEMEAFFTFLRKNTIKTLLTINNKIDPKIINLCDDFLVNKEFI